MKLPNSSKISIPDGQSYISINKEEGEYIYSLLSSQGIKKTLEIGFAYGFSSVYIVSATHARHYAIDPFQKSQFKNYGKQNLKNHSLLKYLKLIEDYDYNALPFLLTKKLKFDFIFIDGDHTFDSTFIDFFYADLLLNKGGYIVLHDTWMRSTQLVASWINKNKTNYKRLKCDVANLMVFQKVDNEIDRPLYHFNEFYNLRGMYIYYYWRLFKTFPG